MNSIEHLPRIKTTRGVAPTPKLLSVRCLAVQFDEEFRLEVVYVKLCKKAVMAQVD